MRQIRVLVGLLVVLLLTAASEWAGAEDPVPEAARQFLTRPDEPMPTSVAVRRLEATAQRLAGSGWMRVRVSIAPGVAMHWTALEEGGSARIRHDVLREMLDSEAETVARNLSAGAAMTEANYRFLPLTDAQHAAVPAGLVRFRVEARRRDQMLVDGTVWTSARDGDLVQIDGRLAKSPSFWVRSVDVMRRYARIDGIRVPVLTKSVAEVRLAGRTTLTMTYDYESIDGRPVGTPVPAAR